MPFTIITGGSFTSTGAGVKIPLPSSADYFETFNVTQLAAANPNTVAKGIWFGSKFGAGASPAGQGIKTVKTTAMLDSAFSAGTGFTYVTSVPVIEAQNASAITAITAASPGVVSQTNTYSEGDVLQFYGTTGMPQISGMTFQISTVSGAGYTLLGLRAAGFSAPATAGFTRRISKMLAVEPQFLYVTAVTQAAQAVVTCSVDPSQYYVVGMKIHFSIPQSFGMKELDQLTGTIVSMANAATAYQMVIDIDTTAFTAFAFPVPGTSTLTGQTLFATLAPAGSATKRDPVTLVETGYNFQYQSFRTGEFVPYMFLTGGAQSPAGAASDVVNWLAYKLEN
jgi:hypothetical protein